MIVFLSYEIRCLPSQALDERSGNQKSFSFRNWTEPLLAQDQIEAVIYYNYSDYAGMCHPSPGLPMASGCAPVQWVGDKPVLGGRMNLWSGVGPEPYGGKPGFENVSSIVEKLMNETLCPKDATDPNGYSIIPVHVWTHTVADVLEVVNRIGTVSDEKRRTCLFFLFISVRIPKRLAVSCAVAIIRTKNGQYQELITV